MGRRGQTGNPQVSQYMAVYVRARHRLHQADTGQDQWRDEMINHLHAVRLPSWGLSINRADYYGYRWGLHLGRWLIFMGGTR